MLRSVIATLWTLVDAPHKWACLLMLFLVYRVGTAVPADAALAELTYKYMIYTFVVVGGYARGAEILSAAGGVMANMMQGLMGKPPVTPAPPAAG